MKEEKRRLQVRTRAHAREEGKQPPSPVHPPMPAKDAPPDAAEVTRWVAEAEQLEDVGRLLSLLPTQQLAQMAEEAGPSMLGEKEPDHKRLWPTVGGKAPRKEFLATWASKKALQVLMGDSCPLQNPSVPKEHGTPHQEMALCVACLQDNPDCGQIWHALPGMSCFVSAGSSRGISGLTLGRCEPLCHTC